MNFRMIIPSKPGYRLNRLQEMKVRRWNMALWRRRLEALKPKKLL